MDEIICDDDLGLESLTTDINDENRITLTGTIPGTGGTECIEFTYTDCKSCQLLSVLWDQYHETGEKIRVSVPIDDLLYIQMFSRYTNTKKPIYVQDFTPLTHSIGRQLNDVWYDDFFHDISIGVCISLYKTCEYVGISDLSGIIERHISYQLNTNDTITNKFLSMI